MRTWRAVLGVAGLALLGTGAWLVVFDTRHGTVPWLAVWLAGSVGVHDFLLVPVVLLIGLGLRRAPARPVWRAAALSGGCLTLLALPLMLWEGSPRNPTVLPLNYPLNWALALAGTALVTVCALGVRAVLVRAAPSRTSRAGCDDRTAPPEGAGRSPRNGRP
jgi:hypothetical protein